MPAIKDVQWNYTTSTTGTTITVPVPNNVQNDLLILVLTTDTNDGTDGFTTSATGQGWTLIHRTVNTALQQMYWKLASASEPASYTFTSTDSETYNGCIISIEDINTTNPFGNPAIRTTSNQTAAAKFTMPTVTTNVANSLILYVYSSSVNGVPSMLEGPVVSLIANDGSAESTSVGWGFKASTGTTANNVTVSNVATGAGISTTLQIAPPSGGATKIPAYPSADACIYVDPLNGTTAFNGNTAIAATADTNYGTSLGGFTASDSTFSPGLDVGINSFHSTFRFSSVSASTNLAGVELVLSAGNRVNVTGKNILCHVGPVTEGQLQRFSSVASGRGIWFGMRSNTASGGATTGYKIWQVYGVEKGSLRHQPIVINPSSTTTKATSGTLDAGVVTSFAWWLAGSGVTTTVWDLASLWVLGTTTVVGGNSTTPINLAGIEKATASGKERKSTIIQGSSQLISYQPIQLGAGDSTNFPTYLDLNATSIEFPKQYDDTTLDVQYNSTDNVAGITYFAGASDTIKHRSSSISSGSKFHWRIASGSSATATYDFSGLSIINAGDVVLRAVTTFSDIGFTSCTTITQNSALVDSCSLTSSTIAANNINNITNCSFTKGTPTSHAVTFAAPGGTTNITWDNTLSGYVAGSAGSNVGTTSGTGNEAIYITGTTTSTINITVAAGATIPSIRKDSTNVTVNVTANQLTFTLTNIQSGSELRVYSYTNINDPTTYTELVGVETVGGSPSGSTFNSLTLQGDGTYTATYTYNGGTAIPVVVVAHNLNYQFFRTTLTLSGTADTPLQLFQISDRNYDEGATPYV